MIRLSDNGFSVEQVSGNKDKVLIFSDDMDGQIISLFLTEAEQSGLYFSFV